MKYVLLALAMALIVAVTSCEHGKVELPVGDTGTEVTTVTKSTESSDIPETTEETDENSVDKCESIVTDETTDIQEPESESESIDDSAKENSAATEEIYFKPDPWKFASDLTRAYWMSEEIVMYYDNGTNQVKFELVITDDDEKPKLKINDSLVIFSVTHDDGGYFEEVYVADEFIVVLSSVTGSDSGCVVYIFDYAGNILYQSYYLTNTCIAAYSIVSVDNDKIVVYGTKMSAAGDIVFKTYDYANDMFAAWSEYLCECPVYECDLDSVIFDKSYLDQFSKVNKDDIVSAKFEMDYLGNGRFSKWKMLPGEERISDTIEWLMQQPWD